MDTLELLKTTADFIAAVMGKDTEVVVHDMESGKIAYIVNSSLTERKAGDTDQSSVIRLMDRQARLAGSSSLVGHISRTKSSKTLRASNLFIRDDTGELKYALCINQDIDALQKMRSFLDALLTTENEGSQAQDGAKMEDIVSSVIMTEIEREKPFSLDTRESKQAIIARLDEKGVFEVRGAVTKTCDLLRIAQPTLYKYLKEIKAKR